MAHCCQLRCRSKKPTLGKSAPHGFPEHPLVRQRPTKIESIVCYCVVFPSIYLSEPVANAELLLRSSGGNTGLMIDMRNMSKQKSNENYVGVNHRGATKPHGRKTRNRLTLRLSHLWLSIRSSVAPFVRSVNSHTQTNA